jgi:hypothetical protein
LRKIGQELYPILPAHRVVEFERTYPVSIAPGLQRRTCYVTCLVMEFTQPRCGCKLNVEVLEDCTVSDCVWEARSASVWEYRFRR